MHGRTMKSSNTNHVVTGAVAAIRKPTKTHQVASRKATAQNTMVVTQMNLRSAQ